MIQRVRLIEPTSTLSSAGTLKRRLMEILACPIDKHHPLELYVFEEREEIVEGMLTCPECGRWYPIIDEIPELLPDDLREPKSELKWLEKWREKAPQRVLAAGKPFTLAHSQVTR